MKDSRFTATAYSKTALGATHRLASGIFGHEHRVEQSAGVQHGAGNA